MFDKITLNVPKGPNKTRDRCEHLEGSLLVLLKFPFPGIYVIPSVFCPSVPPLALLLTLASTTCLTLKCGVDIISLTNWSFTSFLNS